MKRKSSQIDNLTWKFELQNLFNGKMVNGTEMQLYIYDIDVFFSTTKDRLQNSVE